MARSLAVMQPYLFPYIGYFQLIAAVDRFVFYDDVAWIKNGWINRNRILVNQQPHWLTIPCTGATPNKMINEIGYRLDGRKSGKLLRTLEQSYARAPGFSSTFPVVEKLLFDNPEGDIASLAAKSVRTFASHLGLTTTLSTSSKDYEPDSSERAMRLVNFCRQENAETYINPAGGRELYDKAWFAEQGIELRFLSPVIESYDQFGSDFVPGLSIIDLLMFNSVDRVREMCLQHRLS